MYSEIAAVLPAPLHAAIIILCPLALMGIGVFHAVDAILNRRKLKAAEKRDSYGYVAGGSGNTVVYTPGFSSATTESDAEFREKLRKYREQRDAT